jgi:hypothetical protein
MILLLRLKESGHASARNGCSCGAEAGYGLSLSRRRGTEALEIATNLVELILDLESLPIGGSPEEAKLFPQQRFQLQ